MNHRRLVFVMLTVAVLSLAAALVAISQLSGSRSGASAVGQMDLTGLGNPTDFAIEAFTCPEEGDCVVGGSYTLHDAAAGSDYWLPFLELESKGVWQPPRTYGNVDTAAIDGTISQISCSSKMLCVAVGDMQGRAFEVTDHRHHWGSLHYFQSVSAVQWSAINDHVACSSDASCTAIFEGWAGLGPSPAEFAVFHHGQWSQPTPLRITAPLGELRALRCTSYLRCTAWGLGGTGNFTGFEMTETARGWATSRIGDPLISRVLRQALEWDSPFTACPTSSSCYRLTHDAQRHWFLSLDNRGVLESRTLLDTSGLRARGHPLEIGSATGFGCSSSGNCVLSIEVWDWHQPGHLVDMNSLRSHMVIAVEQHGVWSRFHSLPRPLGNHRTPWVTAISCPRNERCEILGSYHNGNALKQYIVKV